MVGRASFCLTLEAMERSIMDLYRTAAPRKVAWKISRSPTVTIAPPPPNRLSGHTPKRTRPQEQPLLDCGCRQGDRVEGVGGDVCRFVGTTPSDEIWLAYHERDFDLMTAAFDTIARKETP